MFRVDVDAHVDETEATWNYLGEGEERYRPVSIDPGVPVNPGDPRVHRMWLIDGHFELRHTRDDTRSGTTEARRTLEDVEGRLRQWTSCESTSRCSIRRACCPKIPNAQRSSWL